DVVHVEDEVIKLNIKKLKKCSDPKAYLYELLKDFNFTEWDDVVGLLEAQSGKQVFSHSHRLVKDREFLLLSEKQDLEEVNENIPMNEGTTKIPIGQLSFEEVSAMGEASRSIIFVDKDTLKFPLQVRQWREGDVFYPLGMEGKKKLSKYFKDEKLSLIEKEKTWLLCSGDQIVWVIGRRADGRFKVSSNTKSIMRIYLD